MGDWYVEAVDDLERAAGELHAAVERAVGALRVARTERVAGADLVEIVTHLAMRGGKGTRLAPTVAFRQFEKAVTAYRARAIRELVDQNGMTYSDIAALIGVSRQMVARLYEDAAVVSATR